MRARIGDIALNAVIGLPIRWTGWQLLDGLKGALT